MPLLKSVCRLTLVVSALLTTSFLMLHLSLMLLLPVDLSHIFVHFLFLKLILSVLLCPSS